MIKKLKRLIRKAQKEESEDEDIIFQINFGVSALASGAPQLIKEAIELFGRE